jgi:signal transduction histidine kinase
MLTVSLIGVLAATVLGLEAVHPLEWSAPTVRASVEAVMPVLALCAVWLLRLQFDQTRQVRDLVLFTAILMLALLNACSYALPAALNIATGARFAAAGILGKVLAASAFAGAAWIGGDRVHEDRGHPILKASAISVAAVAVALVAGMLFHGALTPSAAHRAEGITAALHYPVGVVLVLGGAGLFVFAAVGFLRGAGADRRGITVLLAATMTLLAAAQLHCLVLPWLAPTAIAPREGMRLIAVALLLLALVRQEVLVRAAMARVAASAERRRVARDLHDGLAQDLAFIAAHGARLAQEMGHEHPLVVAARRALAISRGAIADLSDEPGASVAQALNAVARELSQRFEISISVHARLERDLPPDTREHVTRIVREAIANAARHGRARRVVVSLKRADDTIKLRVIDDGCAGRGRAHVPFREGFGMRSMRERAASVGGHLSVHRLGKGGTKLEVVLP